MKNEFRKIGKVIDAHGIRGDLYVGVFSEDVSWLNSLEEVQLKNKEESTHYKVNMKKPHKKGFICHLENIDNRNASESLKGAEVWISDQIFISKNGEQPYLSELLGFKVIDNDQEIGTIQSFSSNGRQDLLIVHQDKKNYEIPFVKEFVLNMDFDKKILEMDLPEGLLTLNEDE